MIMDYCQDDDTALNILTNGHTVQSKVVQRRGEGKILHCNGNIT